MAGAANPLMAAQSGGGNPSPVAGMLMSAMQQKGQGGGGDAAQDYAQQSAELQGADPGMLLRQLNQINQLLGVMFVQTFQRLPNVANQISGTMKQISKAIKEAQQASSTQQALPPAGGQGSSPINFSAAAPSAGPEAGPGMIGQ